MRKGFTLVELLVVLAIVSLLACLLFPVFAGARVGVVASFPRTEAGGTARKSSCIKNIKQLAVAMQQYAQDYDERLPLRGGDCISEYAYEDAFECPSSGSITGYAIGHNMLGKTSVPEKPYEIVMLWEADHTGNTAFSRHNDGSNTCFLDGHVKWVNHTWHRGRSTDWLPGANQLASGIAMCPLEP